MSRPGAAGLSTDLMSPAFRERMPWIALAALVLAGLIPVIWPGDVPFINDEPQLIASAVAANHRGRLAPLGLLGTYGFRYGPLPTWAYQGLLAITRDLVSVATLHALLMSAITGAALWWLGRSLRLWMWFAPLPLLSPYYWFYARVLWDNPFLLPIGTLALSGYAAFLRSGSRAGLRIAVAAMLAIPLVHLMGLALVVPLAAHMIIVRPRALWTERYIIAAIAGAAVWVAWPYWNYLGGPRAPVPSAGAAFDGWLFPLSSGRLLSARGLEYFYGPQPVSGRVFEIAGAISWIGYGLVWCGIVVAVMLIVRAWRQRDWSARAHLAAIAAASLACQAVLHGLTGKFEHPHYHNGTWISLVVLAWLAVDWLATGPRVARVTATAATAVLAASLLTSVGTLALGLHRSRGTRDVYGPTLANQQRVARELARYAPDSDVEVHVNMWQRFPHTLATLRALNRRTEGGLRHQRIEVGYVSPDPASGAIELIVR